jgi:hypothetical protein
MEDDEDLTRFIGLFWSRLADFDRLHLNDGCCPVRYNSCDPVAGTTIDGGTSKNSFSKRHKSATNIVVGGFIYGI